MRPFLVQYVDSKGPVSVWVEAESAEQIASALEGIEIPDPVPEWATDALMAEFGTYKLSQPDQMPSGIETAATTLTSGSRADVNVRIPP